MPNITTNYAITNTYYYYYFYFYFYEQGAEKKQTKTYTSVLGLKVF